MFPTAHVLSHKHLISMKISDWMKTAHRRLIYIYIYVDVNDRLSRDSRQFISFYGFSWPQTAETSALICIIITTWDITDTLARKNAVRFKVQSYKTEIVNSRRSLRRNGFDPGPVRWWFVVDKVTMGQVPFRVIRFFYAIVIPPLLLPQTPLVCHPCCLTSAIDSVVK
jgi:hypothetical protein